MKRLKINEKEVGVGPFNKTINEGNVNWNLGSGSEEAFFIFLFSMIPQNLFQMMRWEQWVLEIALADVDLYCDNEVV